MRMQHFFFGPIIFVKSRRKFYRKEYFAVAATVVQHSILLSYLLSDSAVPVAWHMRNCSVGIATEQLAARKI
jgi:hypothetical protein